MSTSFYGDVLFKNDQRSKKNYYMSQPLIVRLKTRASDQVNLTQVFRVKKNIETIQNESADTRSVTEHRVVNGTTLLYKPTSEITEKFKLGNDIFKYEIGFKPKDFNNATKSLQLKHVTDYSPATGSLQSTETVKFGTPELGPLRLWATLDFAWNNTNANRLLKNSLNITFQEYNLGYTLAHNLTDFTKVEVQAALRNEKGDFFFRSDALNQIVSLGCHHGHGDRAHHSYEVSYDIKKNTKGIKGYPVTFQWAGEYNVGNGVVLKSKLEAKQAVELTCSWIHAYNAHLRFVFTDKLNLTNLVSEPAKTNYDFGALLEWTL